MTGAADCVTRSDVTGPVAHILVPDLLISQTGAAPKIERDKFFISTVNL